MPLSAPKQRTNTGKIAGDDVAFPADYDAFVGTSAQVPEYVLDGDTAHGICVDFANIPAGAGTAMLRDNGAVDSTFAQLTFDLKLTAVPTSAVQLAEIRNASAKITNVLLNISGGNATLLVRGGGDQTLTGADSTGATTLPVWTGGAVLALNTWYRVQIIVSVGTSTTGKTRAKLTRLSDSVVLAEGARENLNNGTTSVSHHQTGKQSSTIAFAGRLDNLAFSDQAYTYLAAATDPAPPVEEDPAGNEKVHTHLGRTVGSPVGPDEYTQVFGSDGVRVYADDGAGNVGVKFFGPSGTSGFVLDTYSSTSKLSWACELIILEAPSVATEILNFRSTTPGNVISVVLYPDRTLRVNNGDGTQNVLTTSALTLSTRYKLRLAAQVGTTTANGKIRARVTQMNDTVVGSNEKLDANTGTVVMNGARWGKLGTSVSMSILIDNVHSFDGSYGWIDPATEVASAGQIGRASCRERV